MQETLVIPLFGRLVCSERFPELFSDPAAKRICDSLDYDFAEKEFFGDSYHDCDYVFRWSDGRPFSPDYVSDKFPKLLKAHNMPHIRFHELRHSAASNLLSMGFSLKDVQEWLGHSDIKTTANIYGHLDAKRKMSMAEALVG